MAEYRTTNRRASSLTLSSGRVIPVDRGSVFLSGAADAAAVAELMAAGAIQVAAAPATGASLVVQRFELAAGVPLLIVSPRDRISYLVIENTGVSDARLTFGGPPTGSEGLPLNAAPAQDRQGGGHAFEGDKVPANGVWATAATPTTITVLRG